MIRRLVDRSPALRERAQRGRQLASRAILGTTREDLDGRIAAAEARAAELERQLADLGAAMAPLEGSAGVAARYAELRATVHEVRRALRAPDTSSLAGQPAAAAAPSRGVASERFDYVGFERRFRGHPDDVRAAQLDRYGELLAGPGPVVDVGCGRGELLQALAERDTSVVGVEPNAAMARQARDRGVEVHEVLGAEYLRGVEDGSLQAVVAFHVAEHLQVDDLIELMELAAAKLRPGGVLVLETPNPVAFWTLHNSYVLDPTHVWPLHPELLRFLAEGAGFAEVDLRFFAPADSHWTPPLQAPDAPPALREELDGVFRRLNQQLFGPQDYALVARV